MEEQHKFQHQHDLNGCGIACVVNLLGRPYEDVKKIFEKNFYNIGRGIKIFDLAKFLNSFGYNYSFKFFNHNAFNSIEANKYSSILYSITLIQKNETYPVGHYLLKVKEGWVDSWINYPSIDNVHAGIRDVLPGNPWYVIYPKK